jgi:hypothetical protein
VNALCKILGEFNKHILFEEQDKELNKRLNAFLQKREPDYRRPGVHVTDLLDPCFRRLMFKSTDPDFKDPAGDSAGQKVFNCGTATHIWWQNRYLGPMAVLKGNWMCPICERIEAGFKPTEPCKSTVILFPETNDQVVTTCGDILPKWVYQESEVNFELNGIPVTGNYDGNLILGPRDLILEIKSMREEQFKDLKRAVPKDVKQSSIYAWAEGKKGILLVYIDKTTWTIRTFFKNPDPGAVAWIDEQTKVLAMLLKKSKDPMTAPLTCKHKNITRAKRCGARNKCFPSKRKKKEE